MSGAARALLAGVLAWMLVGSGVAGANPVSSENARAGATDWSAAEPPPTAAQGYAELSVLPGGSLHVRAATAARYHVEVWRLGWYGGKGGRRVACVPAACADDRAPAAQPAPPAPAPATGRVDAGWRVTDTVPIGTGWVSGYYVAVIRLTGGTYAGKGYRVPFVVRQPADRNAAILVQASTNTWEAYNGWGGKSLYPSNSTGRKPAVKVSFQRPFDHEAGNTTPLSHEIQLVRFLEREGYDVAYQTDADTDAAPTSLLRPRAVIVNGHAEYWTHAMRAAFDAARDRGQDIVFAGADVSYWQVRYEDGGTTLVGYKSRADPIADLSLETIAFRNIQPPLPECELVGVAYKPPPEAAGPELSDGDAYTVVADPATTPWLARTGLALGQRLPGLVGYEWDSPIAGCGPPGIQRLFYAPGLQPAASVIYRSAAGGLVLSWGSMLFKFGLDAYGGRRPATPGVQAFMRNVLDDMTGAPNVSAAPPQVRVLSARRFGRRHVAVRLRTTGGTVRRVRLAVRTRRGGARIGHARVRRLTTRVREVMVRVRRKPGRRAHIVAHAGDQRVVRRIRGSAHRS